MGHKEYIMETSVWTSKYKLWVLFFLSFICIEYKFDCILNVDYFSDDDSGTMKVLSEADDEPPPLPPKVCTSLCTYASVYTDIYSEM